jgi:hypothetical protein
MLLLTLAIFLLLRNSAAPAGVAVALAALTRPTALLCIPLFALYRPRRAHVLLIASLLTLAPWTIRNAMHFHRLIVVNDAGGFNLWRGTHPDVIALTNERNRAKYAEEARTFEVRTISATHGDWTRLAVDNIRAYPREEVLFALEKAWLYWRPWLNPIEYSLPLVIGSAAFLLPLFALGFIGIAGTKQWPVLVYFAVMWLAHIPFQVVMRFRVPFTDPLLIAFAAVVILHCRGTDSTETLCVICGSAVNSSRVKRDNLFEQLRADRRLRLVRASGDVRGEDQPRIVGKSTARRLGIENVERQSGEMLRA